MRGTGVFDSNMPLGLGWIVAALLLLCGIKLLPGASALQSATQETHSPQSVSLAPASRDAIDEQQAPIALAETGAGQLLFGSSSKGYRQAFHLSSAAEFSVSGMLLMAELRQSFRNESSEWKEGVYVFPLPDTATVSYMAMQLDERLIEAVVEEKQQARRTYEKARNEGRKAALVEQERPNLFTQSIANIAPGETVTVLLRYQQAVSFDAGEFHFRFPMTLTPRYMPGSAQLHSSLQPEHLAAQATGLQVQGWSPATDQVADADRISPWMLSKARNPNGSHRIKLSVAVDAGLPLADIHSPYHDIRVRREGGAHRIHLRDASVAMDRDFELRWRPAGSSQPEAAVFLEQGAGDDSSALYASVMVMPPQVPVAEEVLPRQVVFVIDVSGSMQGQSILQAKKSLLLALNRLRPRDRFNVIAFNSNYRSLFAAAEKADAQHVQRARDFVRALSAGGGTEMAAPLHAALATPVAEEFLQQIVFITDGAVGNETALFSQIHGDLGSSRLFTVGIGSAPNQFFMRKAAQMGRGTFTLISRQEDVAERMSSLFEKLESPVLSQLQIQWPDSLQTETWPRQLPDLYLGEPLVFHTRIASAVESGQHLLKISGKLANQSWQREMRWRGDQISSASTGIDKVWARHKIDGLLDQRLQNVSEEEIREQVLAVALPYQLVSPYSSLVAVEKKISRPAGSTLQHSAVPNLVADGQVPQPQTLQRQQIAYPQTATPALLHAVLGLMALVAAAWVARQRYARA